MATAVVPFGARAERVPYTITVEAGSFHYDPARQVNVMTDGALWAGSNMAGSCTNTNWDSQNDDVSDPYVMH